MSEIIGIGIAASIVFGMMLIIFIKANLVICQPNEVVIISGRKYKIADGEEVGYRIIKGGRGFKIPIIESVNRLSLSAMPTEISISKALCKGIIPINIDGRANIKIAGSEDDGLNNAIERFLGKKLHEISQIAKQAIEGSLRGVLATVTPEEANSKRLELSERIAAEARDDLKKLGIVLDYFKIQNISDEQNYLEAIGRKKNAEILKEAQIAEATAEAEARVITAKQKRIGNVAEAEAEESIVKAKNKLAVHRAELATETNRVEERAKLAGDIARVEEEQLLEERRVALNQKRYKADVVVPAEAEKQAAELKAIGKASKILENGKATAQAIKQMQAQWDEGNTKDFFLIQLMPELLDKVTSIISDNLNIDKLTILDSGNGNGLPTHVKNITSSAVTILEQLKNTTGLDLAGFFQTSIENGYESKIPKELT